MAGKGKLYLFIFQRQSVMKQNLVTFKLVYKLLQYFFFKSCIWVTLNLLIDADSSTNTKTDRNGQKGFFFYGSILKELREWGVQFLVLFVSASDGTNKQTHRRTWRLYDCFSDNGKLQQK